MPLREELGRRFGVPVFVDNDANCAALAEAHIVGASHLVMLTLGTGVGGGVVIDGLTFRGAHGLGAELGHMAVNSDGPPCPGNCPNRGCLEAYCSGQALARDATELAQRQAGQPLGGALGPDGKVLGARARRGGRGRRPRRAAHLWRTSARMLGVGIANYVNVFEPDPARHRRRALAAPRTSSSTAPSRRRARATFPRSGSASRSRSPRAARMPA